MERAGRIISRPQPRKNCPVLYRFRPRGCAQLDNSAVADVGGEEAAHDPFPVRPSLSLLYRRAPGINFVECFRTHKTLHIGTSDYQWFATRVSPAGPTSVSTTPSNHRFIFIFCEVRALHTRKRSARAAAYRRPPRETRFKARSQNG